MTETTSKSALGISDVGRLNTYRATVGTKASSCQHRTSYQRLPATDCKLGSNRWRAKPRSHIYNTHVFHSYKSHLILPFSTSSSLNISLTRIPITHHILHTLELVSAAKMAEVKTVECRYIDPHKLQELLARLFSGQPYRAEVSRAVLHGTAGLDSRIELG
jgi:hypothetical protein